MKKPKRSTLRIQDLYANSERRNGSTCWYWLGATSPTGSPRIWTFDYDVGDKRSMSGPKAVWNISTGSGIGSKLPYRKCFTTACVNPDHIAIAVNRAELNAEMKKAGCFKSDECNKARRLNVMKAMEAQGVVPTDKDTVIAILSMSGTGRSISKRLGISEQVVSRVRRGESHRQIYEEFNANMECTA